jgi:hypothetical protein
MSVAKIAGTLYAIIGFCFGAVVSLVSMVGLFPGASNDSGLAGALFGVMAIVFLPIFYGVLGFVTSLITAALYNAVAGVVGGVEIDIG